VRFDCAAVDRNLFDPEVFESGLVAVRLFVQRYADLVDNLVSAFFLDCGLDKPRLAAVDVVLTQDFLDRLDATLDRRLVIRRAILPQKILENIGRHDRVAFDCFHQILANNIAGEMFINFVVECAHVQSLKVEISRNATAQLETVA
jgi:hypothetical protein